MTLQHDLNSFARNTHARAWTTRDGQKVPGTDNLSLSNDAVKLVGTVLYADLADSTGMVRRKKDTFAAEVYKNYLYCAARIVRAQGGEITAYDGDRLMAVFLGTAKNTSAVNSALKIQWAVSNILQPALLETYRSSDFVYRQRVGIDTSALFVARTGIRGANDLVWVGNAANHAAKMAALDRGSYSSFITATVHDNMSSNARHGGNPRRSMWTDLGSADLGYRIFGSAWRRSV